MLAALALLLLPLLAQVPADAEALWRAGERVAALDAMEAALAADPGDDALRLALVRRAMEVHRYEAALAHARPLGEVAGAEVGVCLVRLGRYEEALPWLDPARPDHALTRVDVLEALGRDAEAAAALERAAATLGADDAGVLLRRGRLHARAGRHREAADAFRAALAREALLPEALYGLGRALVALGERDEGLALLARHRALVPLVDARDFALQSLDLAPTHAPNHAALGDAERALGRTDAALAAYRRAEELAEPAELPPIVLRLARLLDEDLARPEEAVAALGRAFDRAPDPRLAVRAGDVLLAAGAPARAAAWFERGLAVRPGDPAIEERLARARAAEAPR